MVTQITLPGPPGLGGRGCHDSGSRGSVPVRTQWQEPRNFLFEGRFNRGPGLWIPSRSLSPTPALPYRTGAHATASYCQWYDASPSHGRCHPCACLVQPCSTKAVVARISEQILRHGWPSILVPPGFTEPSKELSFAMSIKHQTSCSQGIHIGSARPSLSRRSRG